MASNTRLGSFTDLLDQLPSDTLPLVKPVALRLRAVILEVYPTAIEVVRLGDGAAAYGVGPKKMSESHVYVMPKTGYVNLGFWHGINIPDPEGLLEGTGKKMRHVKIKSIDMAEAPSVRALIKAALKERKIALGLINA